MMRNDVNTSLQSLFILGETLVPLSDNARGGDLTDKLAQLGAACARCENKACDRLKKLQDTLRAINKMNCDMEKLRRWMIDTEHALTKPLVYRLCDFVEIQDQLQALEVRFGSSRLFFEHCYFKFFC